MKKLNMAWTLMFALILMAPLGILLTWDYEDAWGEWGEVQLGENETWVPEQYGGAPLPDYNVEGWDSQFMASIGYWMSAVIGVSMCILVTLGFGKAVELWKNGYDEDNTAEKRR